jgi:hypothetical protein
MMNSTDEKIKTAYDRLTHGRADITDGQLNITNICIEAGVSRASFYRSAHAPAIRHALTNPDAPAPNPRKYANKCDNCNTPKRRCAANTPPNSANCGPP